MALNEVRATARAAAWAMGARPNTIVLDLDSTLVGSHSDKRFAAPTYKLGSHLTAGFKRSIPLGQIVREQPSVADRRRPFAMLPGRGRYAAAMGQDVKGACPDCGAPISEDDTRCPRCGADLTWWAGEKSGLQEAEREELPSESRRERRTQQS